MSTIVFIAFALITIVSALTILFTRNLLYAAFALLLTLLGVAALYVLAGADFLAVTQIMIYVGGVLVLLIFGVMLTQKRDNSRAPGEEATVENHHQFGGLLVAGSLFGLILAVILQVNWQALHTSPAQSSPIRSTVSTIGMQLMTTFSLPFEVSAVLLMVALLGAAYIAGRRTH